MLNENFSLPYFSVCKAYSRKLIKIFQVFVRFNIAHNALNDSALYAEIVITFFAAKLFCKMSY